MTMEHNDLFNLNGKVIVITGGCGVLAGAMAKSLVASGAGVSLWGRGKSRPVAGAVEALARETGRKDLIHGVTVDAGDKAALEGALAQTVREFGEPEVLINGVGGNKSKSPFLDADLASFREILDMNILGGLVLPTQVFASRWIEKKIRN